MTLVYILRSCEKKNETKKHVLIDKARRCIRMREAILLLESHIITLRKEINKKGKINEIFSP